MTRAMLPLCDPPRARRRACGVISLVATMWLQAATASQHAGAHPESPWFGAELVATGREPLQAELIGLGALQWRFRDASGREIDVPLAELVRWGSVPTAKGGILVRLRDASQVVLAPAWADPQPLFVPAAAEEPALLSTQSLGRIRCPQANLDAVLWGVAPDAGRQLAGWDQLRSPGDALQVASQDRLLLTNGDLLSGRLKSIAAPAPHVESAAELPETQRRESTGDAEIVFQSELGTLELSSDRVRGLALAREVPVEKRAAPPATTAATTPSGASPPELPKFRVGLSDGTLLAVYDADATPRGLRLRTCCGEQTPEIPWEKVVFLAAEGGLPTPTGRGLLRVVADQTLRTELRPYLKWGREARWNRSVLGGPLVVGGHRYLHGIGTSTAVRSELAIPAGSRQFAAEVAIDDAAGEGGSVVFGVHLQAADGAWREAYRSRVVRGGDRPLTVRVPLSDEVAAALTTEFASRGDELDYADWLDPRWE